ncbi:tRNA (adenosine(37)-N6)-threonylcarbamoyltransferase complex ATPase subunit type 1 TsaE [Candidatus Peribacteria bacterium]|nr:tRNA (adenosine(37)-N6)-threonylcarbamoyltransferase complex ATPase subunit type 1 TsaE [Candidatus Peribacteria bacterium]
MPAVLADHVARNECEHGKNGDPERRSLREVLESMGFLPAINGRAREAELPFRYNRHSCWFVVTSLLYNLLTFLSMHDKCTIKATSGSGSQKTGASLGASLYAIPVTIALSGELGAGKTTFLQGFASALGVPGSLTSPTYALEQRYEMARAIGAIRERPLSNEFLHLDLYRLTPAQSEQLLHGTEQFSGIRCIEWSERIDLKRLINEGPVIHVHLTPGGTKEERDITCAFHDMKLPTGEEVTRWRADARLPQHITDHCEAVAALCELLAKHLIEKGHVVRPGALRAAARIHDLFRFLDFRPEGHPDGNKHSKDDIAVWESIRASFPGMNHEEACTAFLRKEGYPGIAAIVATHGLKRPPPADGTVEQKLLYYADKRVMLDKVVSLDERFADFSARYGKGQTSEDHNRWLMEAKKTEGELFPDGAPHP